MKRRSSHHLPSTRLTASRLAGIVLASTCAASLVATPSNSATRTTRSKIVNTKRVAERPLPPQPLPLDNSVIGFDDPVDPRKASLTRTTFTFQPRFNEPLRIEADRPFRVVAPWNLPNVESSLDSPSNSSRSVLLFTPAVAAEHRIEFVTPQGSLGYIKAKPIAHARLRDASINETTTLDLLGGRAEGVRVAVKGGRRYGLETTALATVCAFNEIPNDLLPTRGGSPFGQVQRAPQAPPPSRVQQPTCATVSPKQPADALFTIVPVADQLLRVMVTSSRDAEVGIRVRPLDDDRVVDFDAGQNASAKSAPYAAAVVPLWGAVGQRTVLGAIDGGRLRQFGEPWVEREERQTTFLVPYQYRASIAPYILWGGSAKSEEFRVFVARGDDGVFPLKVGESVSVTNRPWLRAIVPFTLVQGRRYELELTGANLRNAGFAVRGPAGRRTTSAGNWNYDDPEDTGDFSKVTTTMEARHGGNWVLEIDPRSAHVVDLKVKVTEIGGRVAYEPVTRVTSVLRPGETVDVDLLPGEWAQMSFTTGDRAENVEPVVQRYRNTTFDTTAADVTIWDPDGRLLYSNNKDLQEEVFTGRLGSETNSAERFALLRPKTTYRMVVDPNGDLAGRFRLSVRSTAAVELIPADLSKGPLTFDSTKAAVLEVRREPIGVAIDGSVCVLSSTVEISGINPSYAPGLGDLTSTGTLQNGFCSMDRSITLPPGVHTIRAFQRSASPNDDKVTLRSVAAGSGTLVTKTVTVEPGATTEFAFSSLNRVKVSLPVNSVVPITYGPTASLRIFDPTGMEVALVDAARPYFISTAAGTYTMLLETFDRGAAESRRPMLMIGQPTERTVTIETSIGRKVPVRGAPGQYVLVKVTKPKGGSIVVVRDDTGERPSVLVLNAKNEYSSAKEAGTYTVIFPPSFNNDTYLINAR